MSDFDNPWKEAIEVFFEDFVQFFFPQVHADVDWSRPVEFLDKELQQIIPEAEHGLRVVDKLVKVFRKDGDEDWLLIHIEIQSQPEAEFERRMYVYNFRLFDRYARKVASLAVLADERADWRPSRFEYDLWGCQIAFRFPSVKLLDFGRDWAGLEQSDNPFAAVVMAHLKTKETASDPSDRKHWKLQIVKGLYSRGWTKPEIQQLIRLIDWMMDLPKELAEGFRREYDQFEQEQTMPYITSMERLAAEEAVVDVLHETIEVLLETHGERGHEFGRRVRGLEDVDLLKRIHRALAQRESLDAVEKLLT